MDSRFLNSSIAELEGHTWRGEIPTSENSFLERRFYELHTRKLKDLSVADVDLYVEQQYGLKYVVPLAINILKENVFIATDYEGALLFNVLNVNPDYWNDNPDQKKEVENLFIANRYALEEVDLTDEIKDDIIEAFQKFAKGKNR